MTRDMTQGRPFGHLWRYALPVLVGNWLQLLYNAADSVIAGRFIGQDALAAEGIAAPVMNLTILAISGLCIGAGVLMSEAFGARQQERLRSAMATMLLFGGGMCMVAAVLGAALTPLILTGLSVPEGIRDVTGIYMAITFLGTPFTFFYNALAAGLRSVGDAKTPLRFLAFSAILNAVLDIILLGIFRLGIVCSAVTTVVAEGVSALLAACYMRRHVRMLCPERGEWRIRRDMLSAILRYGSITALQQAVQPICKVLIQRQVNDLGVSVIAAYNAVTRVDDFACIPEQGIASAITTYIAQNRGAKKPERIWRGFVTGLAMEAGYFLFISATALLLRRPIVSMFVTGEGAQAVIETGASYLGLMAFFYLWPGMTNGCQGFFRGMGRMRMTLLGTAIQAGLRVVFTYLLAPVMGIRGIAIACCVGWSVMLMVEVPVVLHWHRTQDRARV